MSQGNAAQGQHQGIARNKCFADGDVEKYCCGCDGMMPVPVIGMALQGMSLCMCVSPLEKQSDKKTSLILHMVPFDTRTSSSGVGPF